MLEYCKWSNQDLRIELYHCVSLSVWILMPFSRFIHEEMVRMGTTLRSELDAIHRRETQQFEKSVEEAIKEMTDAQKVVRKNLCISLLPISKYILLLLGDREDEIIRTRWCLIITLTFSVHPQPFLAFTVLN